MRQALQSPDAPGRSSESPQREHAAPSRAGISAQQTSQIGMEESRGRGEPQREHVAGRRVQVAASTGLRSTRTTARHRVVSDGGTSNVSEPESLRKTHLNSASVTLPLYAASITQPCLDLHCSQMNWIDTACAARQIPSGCVSDGDWSKIRLFSYWGIGATRRRFLHCGALPRQFALHLT
jgi:hypothetical protein